MSTTSISTYNLNTFYNDPSAVGNLTVGSRSISIFICPANALEADRPGVGGRDSAGFGTCDYAPPSYAQDAAGNLVYAAMTGKPYDSSLYFNYPIGAGPTGPFVNPAKTWQLDATKLGLVDANYGLAKMGQITDGTSTTILMYEDVGKNEKNVGYTGVVYQITPAANEYLDPMSGNASAHWRYTNPDIASGLSKKVNNNKGGTYYTADPNTPVCVWAQHDCGNHSEMFSFHGPGAHAVFADGHVSFISESIPTPLIQAMVTRSYGRVGNEPPIEGIE